jgi:hypothetical protein
VASCEERDGGGCLESSRRLLQFLKIVCPGTVLGSAPGQLDTIFCTLTVPSPHEWREGIWRETSLSVLNAKEGSDSDVSTQLFGLQIFHHRTVFGDFHD